MRTTYSITLRANAKFSNVGFSVLCSVPTYLLTKYLSKYLPTYLFCIPTYYPILIRVMGEISGSKLIAQAAAVTAVVLGYKPNYNAP